MSLLGQALFSRELMWTYHGAKVRETVAVCTKGDVALERVAKRCGITVVCYPESPLPVMGRKA